ncbi:hypothetical protein [Nesterenkonia ebinurensis]|uniref:hypothetical protein n=1 Tax=Nesterenkonia ebinurensis TaxID=2608252 RepID=UPI00123D1C7D|nr:hypothetical protein [Nesterenkonia ebinurensis]
MTMDRTTAYLDELHTALELRETRDSLTDDVVRQVESHIAETGEDPYEAFGDPVQYAQGHSPRSATAPFWALLAASVLLACGGGWLLLHGVINVADSREIFWGIGPIFGVTAGAALLFLWVAFLVTAGVARKKR